MSAAEFSGLVAIVSGGASGIGAAISTELMRRGARVAVLDLDPAPAPAGALGIRTDIGDDHAVRDAVDLVVATWGRVDVIVNNAGIGAKGTVEDNTDADWHRVLDINVLGAVRLTRAAMPHLRESPAAAVVNIASVAATTGIPDRALYSASKGALHALTLAMAADHVREGVRVNCVTPGTAATPWVQRLLESADDPEAELAALNARQPHGRLVSPEEIALAVAYLAGPASGSTVGVAVAVDGGMASLRLREAS